MADIIINGIPEESINSIQVGDKEFIAAAPIPDFYARVTPESPSVELNGNYVNGRVDAVHGVKENPILPSTSIQKVKPEGYYWDEVEIAPAQMIYDNAPSEVAGPNDVKLGKWFLSQNGIEQGAYVPSPKEGYHQGMAELSLGLGLYDPIEEVVPNWLDENKFSFYGFTARYGFDVDKPGFVDENSHEIVEKTYYVQTEEKLITPADSGTVLPSNGKLISEIQISAPNPADIRKGVSIYGSVGTLEVSDGQLDDLTGSFWIFKDNVNVSDLVGGVSAYSNRNYNINFITDDDKGEFEHIYLESTHAYGDTFKYGNGLRLSKYISVYDSHSGWNQMNQRWRPIRITGGSDTTNKYLIAWLLTNAVRV